MRILTATAIALALSLLGYEGAIAQASAQDETPIYGSQLMTQQERYHLQMQARAQERGVTLPDEPPPMPRQGMGMGPGPGGGPGAGGGPMGSGGGPGGPRR